jgi:hypothetical protein
MEEMRNTFKLLVGKAKGRLGRRMRRWEDNIKRDYRGRECEGVAFYWM